MHQKLKVEEHVRGDETIQQSATMFQHDGQRKITDKQLIPRRRVKMIERQMTLLNTGFDEHEKRAEEYKEMMNEHARLVEENKGK